MSFPQLACFLESWAEHFIDFQRVSLCWVFWHFCLFFFFCTFFKLSCSSAQFLFYKLKCFIYWHAFLQLWIYIVNFRVAWLQNKQQQLPISYSLNHPSKMFWQFQMYMIYHDYFLPPYNTPCVHEDLFLPNS